MGVNFSYVRDKKERSKLQYTYSYGHTMLILNLIFIFIPSLWLYWFAYSGHWILFVLSIVRGFLSYVNYRLSFQTLPSGVVNGVSSAKMQLYLGLFLVLLCLVGAILQEVNSTSCYRNDNQTGIPQLSQDPHATDSSVNCYPNNTHYVPAVVILAMLEPVLALIHMVLFSINCSQLWKEAYSKALQAQNQHIRSIPLNTVPYNQSNPIPPPYDPYDPVPQFQQPPHFYPSAPFSNDQMRGQPYYPEPLQPPPQAMVNVQMSQEQWDAVQQILATSNTPPPPTQ